MTAAALFSYLDLFQRGGFTQEQSQTQTRALEQIMIDIEEKVTEKIEHKLEVKELNIKGNISVATKELELSIEKVRKELELSIEKVRADLKTDIEKLKLDVEKLRYDTLKFTIWTGVGVIASLGGLIIGLLSKGFHWF